MLDLNAEFSALGLDIGLCLSLAINERSTLNHCKEYICSWVDRMRADEHSSMRLHGYNYFFEVRRGTIRFAADLTLANAHGDAYGHSQADDYEARHNAQVVHEEIELRALRRSSALTVQTHKSSSKHSTTKKTTTHRPTSTKKTVCRRARPD